MNNTPSPDSSNYLPQFWYTWSEAGYGDLRGGFRIRAVSPELADINSPRVRVLDWYARYKLPGGTDTYDAVLEKGKAFYGLPPNEEQLRQLPGLVDSDPSSKGRKLLSIEGAPICLSFANTEPQNPGKGERILVNNVYIGTAKGDRPGTFFVHILARLPDNFTARDAIALWRSTLWQTTDPPPSEVGLVIEDSPPYGKTLSDLTGDPTYSRNLLKDTHLPELDNYLRFLIHAYLQQQTEVDQQRQLLLPLESQLRAWNEEKQQIEHYRALDEKYYKKAMNGWEKNNLKEYERVLSESDKLKQSQPRRIYIAAKADIVAYLIAKLTEVLPIEWLGRMTFSTYEYEPEKSSCRIVGTSLPPSSKPTNERPRELLSTLALALDHVLNCYLPAGQDRTPARIAVHHADKYASLTVELLAKSPEELQAMIGNCVESAQRYDRNGAPVGSLTVTAYLNAFSSFNEIVHDFSEDTSKDMALAIVIDPKQMTYLALPGLCYKICRLVRQETAWFQAELQPRLVTLVSQGAAPLGTLTNTSVTSLLRLTNDQEEQLSQGQRQLGFLNLLPLLQTLSPVSPGNATWQTFLESMLTFVQPQPAKPGQAPALSQSYSFVLSHPDIHVRVLAACAQVYTDPEQEQRLDQAKPLLKIEPADVFPAFMQKLHSIYPNALPTRWRQFMIDAQLQQLQRDQRWIALVRLEWTWHALLLSEARDCLAQRDEQYFNTYIEPLLEINAGNMGKLLALRLPLVWNYQAVRLFDERSTPVIAKEDIDDLIEHLDSVVSLLKEQLLARNEDAYKEASKFYVKLVKSSFTGKMKLLKALHEMELPNYNVLLDWFLKQTPLSWQEAAELLTEKKEDYKRRDMHVTLLSLYERAQGGYQLMITLLGGSLLREETLEKLLSQARPFSIEEKWAVFQQLPPYIQQYPQSEQIAALYKELTSHTSPYRMPAGGVWLTNRSMSPEERVEQMKQLCRTGQDYASMLQTYVIPTLKSGGNDALEELAIEFFQNFVMLGNYPESESKQGLFTALFEVIREDAKRDRLIEAAKLTERERNEFIVRYSERALPYFYRSVVAMGVYAAAAAPGGSLSFAGKQRLLAGWLERELTVDELEPILAASQLQGPATNGMSGQQFVLAHGQVFPIAVDEQGWFLDTWGAKCITLYAQTAPDRFEGSTLHAYIKIWLSNFPVADFERRKSSVDILTALTGLPTHKYPDLNEVVKAWLAFKTFIERPNRLSQVALTELGSALQVLFKPGVLAPTTTLTIFERIARVLEPGIRDEVVLGVTFALLAPYTTTAQRESILRELCRAAGAKYAQTQDLRIVLPYIKAIPRWHRLLQQDAPPGASKVTQGHYDFTFKLWNLLLPKTGTSPGSSGQLNAPGQIQNYIWQAEKMVDWDKSISEAWTAYAGRQTAPEPQPQQPPASWTGTLPQPAPADIVPSINADNTPRTSPFSFAVIRMRRALRSTGPNQVEKLAKLWQQHSDILTRNREAFRDEDWERIQLAHDFYVACVLADEHSSGKDSARYTYEREIVDVDRRIQEFFRTYQLSGSFLNREQARRVEEARAFVQRTYQRGGQAPSPWLPPQLPQLPQSPVVSPLPSWPMQTLPQDQHQVTGDQHLGIIDDDGNEIDDKVEYEDFEDYKDYEDIDEYEEEENDEDEDEDIE